MSLVYSDTVPESTRDRSLRLAVLPSFVHKRLVCTGVVCSSLYKAAYMPHTCRSVQRIRCSRFPVASRAALPTVRPNRGRRVIMEAVGQPPDPKKDPDRPQCHVMARRGWINDPNGPIFFGGKYHLCVSAVSIAHTRSNLNAVLVFKPTFNSYLRPTSPRDSLVPAPRQKLLHHQLYQEHFRIHENVIVITLATDSRCT